MLFELTEVGHAAPPALLLLLLQALLAVLILLLAAGLLALVVLIVHRVLLGRVAAQAATMNGHLDSIVASCAK
jgi:hypothetical protein